MTARILIIAGSDSGGGAGIQADIKTVTMLGGHAMTAITAVTAQNTLGVSAVHPIPTDIVIAQIDAVLADIGADAIKIGMIGSAETAEAVAARLEGLETPIVFDPVMVATSGSTLADATTIAAFEKLMRLATLTTPNLPELEALGGDEALNGMTLITGGHADGELIVDRLIGPIGEVARWEGERIDTTSTHGTGCTLASAIATGLGQGMSLADAIGRARLFVRMALREAPGFGKGHGPMGHQAVRMDAAPDMRLNQFLMLHDNYQDTLDFYAKLGLTQIVDSPGNRYVRYETPGGATLSFNLDAAAACFECDNVDRTVADLKAKGITFHVEPADMRWGWREAWTRDPSGNLVCFYQAGENRRYPPWRI